MCKSSRSVGALLQQEPDNARKCHHSQKQETLLYITFANHFFYNRDRRHNEPKSLQN